MRRLNRLKKDVKLTAAQKLAAGRYLAKRRMPYFGAAIFSLIPRPVSGMMESMGQAMACTPNGVLIYDPKELETDTWGVDDVEFALLNQVSHLIRNHAKVRETLAWDPATANKAFDASVNDDLFAAGCEPRMSDMLPSKVQDPTTKKPMPDGKTPHAYYAALKAMGDDQPGTTPGARPGGGNGGGIAGNPLPGEDQHSGQGQQGGGGGGQQQGKAARGRSEAELNRIRKQVAREIQSATEKGRGNVPGGWQIWANTELKPPKIRWQDKLRRNIRGAISNRKGMMDYTYARPSRRQGAIGYGPGFPLLPAMTSPKPSLVVAVDTSGSMSSDDLARAISETKGILSQTDADVHLLSCDAEVHGPPRKVRSWKEVQGALKGGGGTDFGPIFQAVRGIPEKPKIVVVLTDGGGPAPAAPPPGVTIIWVLIGKKEGGWSGAMVPWVEGGSTNDKVTYGEKIWVDD